MREPVRIGLRLLGVVMALVGVAGLVLLVVPGPRDVAEWMGKSCSHTSSPIRRSEQCNVMDVVDWVFTAPILILVGAVLVLALGRDHGAHPGVADVLMRTPSLDLRGEWRGGHGTVSYDADQARRDAAERLREAGLDPAVVYARSRRAHAPFLLPLQARQTQIRGVLPPHPDGERSSGRDPEAVDPGIPSGRTDKECT